MKCLRFGIDIDNVIRNARDSLVFCFKLYPPPPNELFSGETYAKWMNMHGQFTPESKEEKRDLERIKKYIYKTRCYDIFYKFPIEWEFDKKYYYGHDMLLKIKKNGHKAIIVSDQKEESRFITLKWLSYYSIEFDELHYTSKKYEANCDIYIDDNPYVLDSLIKHGKIDNYCYKHQWNLSYKDAIHIEDWHDLEYKLIERKLLTKAEDSLAVISTAVN